MTKGGRRLVIAHDGVFRPCHFIRGPTTSKGHIDANDAPNLNAAGPAPARCPLFKLDI